MSIRDRLLKKFHNPEYRKAYADSHLDAAIALQIKALRLQRGWSQEKLAKEAGLKQSQISAMEQTDFSSWTLRTLRKVADALSLPLLLKFASWGELVEDACRMRPAELERPAFEHDEAFADTPATSHTNDAMADVVSLAEYRPVYSSHPPVRDIDDGKLASTSSYA